MSILVCVKRSRLAQFRAEDPERLEALLREPNEITRNLVAADAAHQRAMEVLQTTLDGMGVAWATRELHELHEIDAELVLTFGGDGTLLWTSHHVPRGIPVLAINSDPGRSVGYFCAAFVEGDQLLGPSREAGARLFDAALHRTLPAIDLSRMQVELDEKILHQRVLNEVLFCHACPAATSRFVLKYGKKRAAHVCSGVWAGPAAGSTAAQRSAGGDVLPLDSPNLQWVVREPYRPRNAEVPLTIGQVEPGSALSFLSKMTDGRLYIDGAEVVKEVPFSSEVRLRRSEEPLTLLGFSAS